MKKLKYGIVALFALIHAKGFSQNMYELNQHWVCKKNSDVASISPNKLSTTEYSLKNWIPATVPGTVLTTLINNKTVPDPFYGMNNNKIPDIYFTGKGEYTYWFVNDFNENKPKGEEQVWLNFRGINYGCDVYLNGKKLNKETFKGMFLRQRYNITSLLNSNGKNRLAVIVYPPDAVGNPNGGQGGDGTIAKNVSHQYVAGWDWIQPIRDRNTGIWDKVTIEKTGAVDMQYPHVITKVPGVRQPDVTNQAPANVLTSVTLHNNTAATKNGTIKFELAGKSVEKSIALQPNSTQEVALPELIVANPKLWWPNTYGPQNLYTGKVIFTENNGVISDSSSLEIGIRQMRHEWNAHTRSMQVSVNGQPIFIRGGNWVISDELLRFSKERYDAEIRFHKEMNLNLIRVWGGAITERPEFYEACDKYGMLVMQDFWGSGDCNGRWIDPMKLEDQWTRRKYPDDHSLFVESASDMIKMIRNYPSLAIWCGGNEITLVDDIQHALKDSLMPKLDGTRWFIDYSNSDSMSYNSIGGNGDGPYGIQTLPYFWSYRTWPFNSEIGSVGVGDIVSLRRFLPKENQVIPIEIPGKEAVDDSVITYHKYIGYGNSVEKYGKPKDLEDFARKAQLVNYDQYRSLIEGFIGHQWDWYSGIMIWKTQNPWTALRGQMYDYYLDPNACLYGLRTGGQVLHGMWNPADSSIYIANNSFKKADNIMLSVKVYDMNGKDSVLTNVFSEAIPQNSKKIMYISHALKELGKKDGLFLVVELKNDKKALLDQNIYWLPNKEGDYTGLNKMPTSKVDVAYKKVKDGKITVTFSNPKDATVSFFNRVSVVDKQTGDRVLPTFYSDNYVSILPGEQKTIEIEYPFQSGKNYSLEVDGWNKKATQINLN
ncbi:glycoside hydrolase family 2 protein [Rhizosphaericola mali]|uniref:Glycosyl hydrolase n=1 Tax=Rhizosphaericola mali TaxID=2545455 RepID=A0A5P2FXG6_9BACT|nr:glycoside hydrolase family 2 TIM barrel-domain containing protein [Rhizosphaericola mali]QES88214.1 glycosyl hydrolase [Rhizosphaericola mali]